MPVSPTEVSCGPWWRPAPSTALLEVAWLAGRSWILTQPWGTAGSRLPATEWALVSACGRVGEASTPAAAPQPALRGPLLRHLRFLSQPLDPTALGGANSLPSPVGAWPAHLCANQNGTPAGGRRIADRVCPQCTRTRGPAPVGVALLDFPTSPSLAQEPGGQGGGSPTSQMSHWGLEFRTLICRRAAGPPLGQQATLYTSPGHPQNPRSERVMAAEAWRLERGAPRVPAQTVLFQGKRAGLTYRVPSRLPVPPGPTLLAFAEQQLSPDDAHAHRLVQRTGTLAGGPVRWGAARVLGAAALDEHRSRSPCPVHVARTAVFLFIAVHGREAAQIAAGENAARLCCVTSGDAGRSWGGARDLTAEAVGGAEQDWATFAVGSTHGVRLGPGRLLVLAYMYRVDRRECFGEICGTDPHSFGTWHRGGLVPNLRSGEGQLAVVHRGPAGGILYCNACSPLGSHVQVLSVDEGASFLPGELVLALAETAGGCQDSIVGFPAPPSSRPEDEGCSMGTRNPLHLPHLCPEPQEPPEEEGAGDTRGGGGLGGTEGCGDGPGEPGPGSGLGGNRGAWTPEPGPPSALSQSPTWLLYSHPVGRRAQLHMGIRLSRSSDPHSCTEPWAIHEGPSGYSDLASIRPTPERALTFACLYESGTGVSYEEISFCMFSLQEVLGNVRAVRHPSLGDKPLGRCRPS
ncbi:LOW QUALITY PROTEIN: sialidase-4 [Megaptera novaeangliae]